MPAKYSILTDSDLNAQPAACRQQLHLQTSVFNWNRAGLIRFGPRLSVSSPKDILRALHPNNSYWCISYQSPRIGC